MFRWVMRYTIRDMPGKYNQSYLDLDNDSETIRAIHDTPQLRKRIIDNSACADRWMDVAIRKCSWETESDDRKSKENQQNRWLR